MEKEFKYLKETDESPKKTKNCECVQKENHRQRIKKIQHEVCREFHLFYNTGETITLSILHSSTLFHSF